MDNHLTPLVNRDGSSCALRLGLGWMCRGHPRVVLSTYCPAVTVRDYMLIFAHFSLLILTSSFLCHSFIDDLS